MIDAYRIGVSLVLQKDTIIGPLGEVLKAMERVDKAARSTQMSLNEMVTSLRGAARVATSFADAMERAAKAAAATASSLQRANTGGGAGSATTFSGVAAAAAPAAAGPRVVGPAWSPPRAGSNGSFGGYLSGPTALPLQLPYYKNTPNTTAVGGVVPPNIRIPGYSASTNFTLQGQPYTPNAGLVPVGGPRPTADYTGRISPEHGVPVVMPGGGGSGMATRTGFVLGDGVPIGLAPINRRVASGPTYGDFAQAGVYGTLLGSYLNAQLSAAMHQGMDSGSQIDALQRTGFSPAQIARAKAEAFALTLIGIEYNESLGLERNIQGFTANPDASLKMLPVLGRNAAAMGLMGRKGPMQAIERAMQAGELTGLNGPDGKPDYTKWSGFTTKLTAIALASGDNFDMGKYATAMIRLGAVSETSSEQFLLEKLPAYVRLMNGQNAGTAFQSLSQSLLSAKPNTVNKKIIAEQTALGLRDRKTGLLPPKIRDMLTNDSAAFLAWVNTRLENAGFHTVSEKLQEINKLYPRNTITSIQAKALFDSTIIEQEAARNHAAMYGPDPAHPDPGYADKNIDKYIKENPITSLNALNASFHLLQSTLADKSMKDVTATMDKLSAGLRKLAAAAEANPHAAQMIVDVAAVSAGLIGLGGVLSLLAFAVAPFVRIGKGMANALRTDTVTPAEVAAGKLGPGPTPWARSVAANPMARFLGRFFGAVALPLEVKQGFYDYPKSFFTGSFFPEGSWSGAWDTLKQDYQNGDWLYPGQHAGSTAAPGSGAPTKVTVNNDKPIAVIVTNGRDLISGTVEAQARAWLQQQGVTVTNSNRAVPLPP